MPYVLLIFICLLLFCRLSWVGGSSAANHHFGQALAHSLCTNTSLTHILLPLLLLLLLLLPLLLTLLTLRLLLRVLCRWFSRRSRIALRRTAPAWYTRSTTLCSKLKQMRMLYISLFFKILFYVVNYILFCPIFIKNTMLFERRSYSLFTLFFFIVPLLLFFHWFVSFVLLINSYISLFYLYIAESIWCASSCKLQIS